MAAIIFPDPNITNPFTDLNGDIWDYNLPKTRWARRPAPLAAVATSGSYSDLTGSPASTVVVMLTTAEYYALPAEEQLDATKIYALTDEV